MLASTSASSSGSREEVQVTVAEVSSVRRAALEMSGTISA